MGEPVRSRRRVGAWVAAPLLVVSACSGGSSTSGTSASSPPSTRTQTLVTSTTQATDRHPPTSAPITAAAPITAPTPTTATAPRPGGVLTVALDGESNGFSPQADSWAQAGHIVADAIFDTLASLDANGIPQPDLAESITANSDSTVWTITLRPNVVFHDGEPLDADAVKQNFDVARTDPNMAGVLQQIASVDIIDGLTLTVTMSSPWGTFPTMLVGGLGSQLGYIAAPAMLDDPDGGRHPIGTGPFEFDEWTLDDHLTVTRNESYWRGPVALEKVVFRPIPDPSTLLAAFQAGDVDVMYTATTRDIVAFLDDQQAGRTNVVVGSPSDPDVLMVNTSRAPLDDVRVRRALAMSIDIDRLLEYLHAAGVKTPMYGPYSEGSYWYTPTDYPRHDPDGARALIEEYRREVGPVEFDYVGNADAGDLNYQQLLQSMWADVGITANIVSVPQSQAIEAALTGAFGVTGWGGIGAGDPDNDYQYLHSGGGLNLTGYTSPAIDAALDAGRTLSDPAARQAQYAIVQHELAGALPYIWLTSNQFAVVGQRDVQGLAGAVLPDGAPAQVLLGPRFSLRSVWLNG